MNQAEIEAMVDARVSAALAPKPIQKPECRNTKVVYTVARMHECFTKKAALECAFELSRRGGRPVVFYPWDAEGPGIMSPEIPVKQQLFGSWNNGYDRKLNFPIRAWIFSNPISPELAKDSADGIFNIDVPQEGNDND
jgi:hypothetical protein